MSVPQAVSQLMSLLESESESTNEEESTTPLDPSSAESLSPSTTLAISLSRVGDPSQKFVSGTLEELSKLEEEDFGGPLHSFVIVGRRFHALERDFAARWSVNKETWNKVSNETYAVRD